MALAHKKCKVAIMSMFKDIKENMNTLREQMVAQ